MDYLKSIDTGLFLFLNSQHNAFFDFAMYWFSDRLIWLPLCALIIFWVIKHYRKRSGLILLFVALVILLCDQTASHLLKNWVHRLRPSHEASLAGLVHLSKAGAGGLYGFVSSHAANAFGLATFLYFVLDDSFKPLKYGLIIWALFVSYSRIYNGVHYPGDVLVGILLGMLIGFLFYILYVRLNKKRNEQPQSQGT